MKLILVGVRHGNRVIHWPGVISFSVIVLSASSIGANLTYLLLGGGFPLLPIYVPTLGILLGTLVGANVRRSLEVPIEELTSLD